MCLGTVLWFGDLLVCTIQPLFFMKLTLVGGQISKKAMTVINPRVTVRVERKRNEQRGGTHDIAAPITLY